MNKLDKFRGALRAMDGNVTAFESPTLLSIIAELRRGDVSDQRLRALQLPSRSAVGSTSSRPTMSPTAKTGKFTAVVQMRGVATYNFEWPGYAFSTLALARTMHQLGADSSVENVVLDIDTPSGQVTGTEEAADAVWQTCKRKPVVGLVNALCASAGYWIGSQCTRLVGVPSADVGSIGVLMLHVDQSKMLADIGINPTFIYAGKYKVEGNSLEPLSAAAKQFYQAEVDKTYSKFVSSVARGRGVGTDEVRNKMGGGRCFGAQDAIRAKMIDAIQTPDAAVAQVASGIIPTRSASLQRPGDEHRARLAELARDPASTSRDAVLAARARLAVLRES
jgi:signal peptide peptidase SppA